MPRTHREEVLVRSVFRSVTLDPAVGRDSNASGDGIRRGRFGRQAAQEGIKRLSHIDSQNQAPSREECRDWCRNLFSASMI
jgi:hypothetical protein